jgi:hypothetical protein
MKHRILMSIIGAWAITLSASNASAAKDNVFTWTDEKGVTHYGERPPKDSQARQIKTRTGHSEPTPEPTPSASAGTTTPTDNAAAESFKDPERCTAAQKNLEILNTVARIKLAGEDGVQRVLSEDEKAAQRAAMEAIIEQACE